ncbi:SET domain-containing protein 4 [Pectinophora gossypiella]|uniref:SET domain-containing protein 4 n=1 Tax=Pectinophora gossypiella TaxID=13191 RepID=UPI00214DF5BB|nr:SET domain-containing protein 4 [Pectinophora gossypiella]
MGRTHRKRRHGKARNFYTCGDGKEIILLNSWLSKQGMRCNEKLVLAVFNDTGRGVLTKRKICAGEELLTLPLNSTINVTTILTDLSFCNIFLENKKDCLVTYKQLVSFQSLMALYLAFLKLQGPGSKWFVYLESLPKEYTVPYFLPNDIKSYVDKDIQTVISKQHDIIHSSFHIFEEILQNSKSDNISVHKLKHSFNMPVYEWAYFTVNTRCVYMDLSNVIDLRNIENCILNIITDNTKISLCPYLDMINHSPNARNETKLIVSKNIENISVGQLDKTLFSDVWFSIYTKNNFDPYSEVFICYGDSHNLKLITEYGFYLPLNDLDYVSFEFEHIISYLKTKSIKLSQEQMSFINGHNLNKDLYIDIKGLSFNFYGLLMVVKYFYKQNMDVSRLIYSAALCTSDKVLNELIAPVVKEKLENIKQSLSKLETCKNNCILNNCKALMCQYVVVLEKFIKC